MNEENRKRAKELFDAVPKELYGAEPMEQFNHAVAFIDELIGSLTLDVLIDGDKYHDVQTLEMCMLIAYVHGFSEGRNQ